MDDSQIPTTAAEDWTDANSIDSADVEEVEEDLGEKLTGFIRLCWSRKWFIVGVVVAGILLSLIYALTSPNIYVSTTTLMPPEGPSSYSNIINMLSSSSAAASLGSEALGLNDSSAIFMSILQSRNVQDGLIARFGLLHYYKSRTIEDARSALAADTTISEDRKSEIITISVKERDPKFAANLTEGYVTELNRVVNDDSTSSARRERVFLEGRLADVKQQLDDSSKALSQFSTKSKAIDMPSQAKSMVDTGLRLQAELIDGRGQLAALKQTYSEDN